MKVVLQTEASECGIACLTMVANFYGHKIDLSQMRQSYSVSLKGTKLSDIIKVSSFLGFSARPLRLDLTELRHLALPCILHWDINHFVVLRKVSRNSITIIDPAYGDRIVTYTDVSSHFTGVALELKPLQNFKPQVIARSVSIKQLTGKVIGLWRALGLILLFSFAIQVFVLVTPFFMQWIVDKVLVSSDASLLLVLGIAFLMLLLVQTAIGLFRSWAIVELSAQLKFQWMSNVFAHLIKLPTNYFEKRHLGDISSRMQSVRAIQQAVTTGAVESVIDGLMAVVILLVMLYYSAKLAVITILAAVIYTVVRAVSFNAEKNIAGQSINIDAKQQSHFLESIRGIQTIKLTGMEARRQVGYSNLMNDVVNMELRSSKYGIYFSALNKFLFGAERIVVIWFGSGLVMNSGVFSVGMLIAYLSYKDQFTNCIISLIEKVIQFRMLRLHGERLADIVLTRPDQASFDMPESPINLNMSINVLDLSFRYSKFDDLVIQNCNFSVIEGESVAIVGASGCGKTTLVKLLLGLIQPESGKILCGGKDISQIGISNYRKNIGSVMQDDQLFAGSIADNISFFDENFDIERIEQAARMAAIHDEIIAMPMAYHSLIGDMGTSLSGVQKQRVILARALYRQPKILFLDEATSHLDIHNERLVNDAVKQLNITKIIIAHRPETIASADRVLVMQGGKIVQDTRQSSLAKAELAL